MLIDVKYARDWQLVLKKNLQDSVVKPIIFATQKIELSVKDFCLTNMSKFAVLYGYVHIY